MCKLANIVGENETGLAGITRRRTQKLLLPVQKSNRPTVLFREDQHRCGSRQVPPRSIQMPDRSDTNRGFRFLGHSRKTELLPLDKVPMSP